ncbi:pH-response regulator protein palI/prr-like protein [Emericellopsis cladophorae]|uniref:PH-response regulator protein palI/prr-like protein n=1 Tax=Emericellopsis cladophorae TaxID=2686198 RepID=A0A9P9Y1B3_9HYPO|nr:pH-response regulator protein palI/prr-like protein [Emericellopsis cladophorae]KAI6781677.1 pH-response regulator protein palI/prr-like protein [Emericellopsis cladophorae]
MAVSKLLHYAGSALLFIAMILTIVVDISAPVVKDISFVSLDLPGNADVQFGVFGYCYQGVTGSESTCSSASIGYDPAGVLERVADSAINNIRADGTKALSNVFVLHPVGTGVLFIAFILSLIAKSTVGGILATLAAAVATVINVVAVAVDFAVFSILLDEVKNGFGEGRYGNAIYIALAAAILSVISTVLMFATCCAGRRRRRRESRKMAQY